MDIAGAVEWVRRAIGSRIVGCVFASLKNKKNRGERKEKHYRDVAAAIARVVCLLKLNDCNLQNFRPRNDLCNHHPSCLEERHHLNLARDRP